MTVSFRGSQDPHISILKSPRPPGSTFDTCSKHIVRILATHLPNALQAGLQHSIGWRVLTLCIQALHVPTLSVLVFSDQTSNKDHNEQLSPCLRHLTQFCKNVKYDFID